MTLNIPSNFRQPYKFKKNLYPKCIAKNKGKQKTVWKGFRSAYLSFYAPSMQQNKTSDGKKEIEGFTHITIDLNILFHMIKNY